MLDEDPNQAGVQQTENVSAPLYIENLAPWSALVLRKHLCKACKKVLVGVKDGVARPAAIEFTPPVACNPRVLWPRGCVRVDWAVLSLVHEAHGDEQDAQGTNDPVVPRDLVPARLAREEVFLDAAKQGSDNPSA